MSVAIIGAAAVSPLGLGWRGLGDEGTPHAATLLATSHPGVSGFEVPAIAEADDAGNVKTRRLMSRSARFAAIAARDALRDAGWTERQDVGYWLGVGASGGPLEEIIAMLRISTDDGAISLAKLGDEGLLASNPLNTFQVLNNFSMCHGAILEGTGGPNGAFFSRGAGTVHALAEAVYAIENHDCDRALAGGADTTLHPVTWAELARDGMATQGLIPSEGAGIVALARDSADALAIVEHVGVGPDAPKRVGDVDLVVIAPWGEPSRRHLSELARGANVIDVTAWRGEALAATPALAWLAGLDRIVSGRARKVAVLSMGTDNELGVVLMRGRS